MNSEVKDLQWWLASTADEKLSRLNGLYRSIEQSQTYRRAMNIHHMRLFCDRDMYGAGGYGNHSDSALDARRLSAMYALQAKRPRLSLNVVRNMINAAVSMMSRGRPRPMYLTNGGDFDEKERAKLRSRFVEAVFQKENTYLLGQRAVQCGCILGTGAIKVIRDYEEGRVRHEYAYAGEILVDETEAVYGAPKTMMQVRAMDRLAAQKRWPRHAGEIERSQSASTAPFGNRHSSDQVVIVEAWHLPSTPKSKDGKHAVFCDSVLLFEEEYRHMDFPFAFWRWEIDPLGFWGTGIASELTGIQFEINETIKNMQANWWSAGNLKILIERGSKVHKAHLNNSLRGTIVEYTGQPPTWLANEAVAPGLMNYLQFLLDQAYNLTGISQLNAQSQTPAASMSGRARLIADQNESQRFLSAQRRNEDMFMALSERTLEAADDIQKFTKKDIEVFYQGRKYMDPVRLSDIGPLEGPYEIQVFPTSIMPSTPAGKMAMVERFEAMGYVDKDQAIELLDFPDLNSETDFETGWKDLIDKRIQAIVSENKYLPPHPDMPLDYALKRSLQALAYYENNGCPEDRLDQLRKFRTAVTDMLKPPPAPAAPPMPGAPMPGGGVPMPAAGGAPAPLPDAAAVPLITGEGQAA